MSVFVSNMTFQASRGSGPVFRVFIPDPAVSPTAKSELCMVPGTWRQTQLPSGNYQCSFTMEVRSGTASKLQQAIRYFAAVNEQMRNPLGGTSFVVNQAFHRASERIGTSRVFKGSVTPVDHNVAHRFQGTKFAHWVVSFERYKYYEYDTRVLNPGTVKLNMHGLDDASTGALGASQHRMDNYYAPGGLGRNRVTRVWLGDSSTWIKKLWLGIQNNRNFDGSTSSFTAHIGIAGNNVKELDSLSRVVDNGGLDVGGIVRQRIECNWTKPGGVKDAWAARFMMPMGAGWNRDVDGYYDDAAHQNRLDHRGRYRLLMRFRTNQPDGDEPGGVVQTGIRGITLWRYPNTEYPYTWQGQELWIKHDNSDHHWVELGVIEIFNDYDYHLSIPNMGRFCIGLETMVANLPSGVVSDNIGRLGLSQDYAFIVERFHLIPADRSMFIKFPGAGLSPSSEIRVSTTREDGVVAVGHDGAFGENQVRWEVREIDFQNWTPPVNPRSYVTGIVEPRGAAAPLGTKITLRLNGRLRSEGEVII